MATRAVLFYIPPTSSPQLRGYSTQAGRQVLGGGVALGIIRREGPPIFGMPCACPVRALCLILRGRHRFAPMTAKLRFATGGASLLAQDGL